MTIKKLFCHIDDFVDFPKLPLSRILLTSISQIPRSTFLAEQIPKTSHGTNEKKQSCRRSSSLPLPSSKFSRPCSMGLRRWLYPPELPPPAWLQLWHLPSRVLQGRRLPSHPSRRLHPRPHHRAFFGFVFSVFDFFSSIIAGFFDFVLGIFGF